MSFWTRGNIKRVVGGVWLSRGRDPETMDQGVLEGVSTDSRSIKCGQVFIALRGERFDGHQFLRSAVEGGAGLLIVDDEASGRAVVGAVCGVGTASDLYVLRVPDTGRALLKLASAYRRTLERTRVVGVVGSNGKTTTARLIATVLAGGGLRGTASPKSFNNAVGVPLTILSALPTDQYLICEIGTNAPGEIAMLAEVVRPDVAVLTSIGREHLEGFGTLEEVAREEGAVLRHMEEGAIVIAPTPLPEGAGVLEDLLRGVPNVLRFGVGDGADLRAVNIRHEGGRLAFSVNGKVAITMGLIGAHNAYNGLAAFAVGRRFGVDEAKIAAALGAASGPPMRLEPVRVGMVGRNAGGELTFIHDAYNANPDSMLASLNTFQEVMGSWPGVRRRVVVLGDMRELGAATEASHREIGRRVGSMSGIDHVVLIGPMMGSAATEVRLLGRGDRMEYLPMLDDGAMAAVANLLLPGDLVLLKGSRGTRLERVVQACRGELPTIASAVRSGAAVTGAPKRAE